MIFLQALKKTQIKFTSIIVAIGVSVILLNEYQLDILYSYYKYHEGDRCLSDVYDCMEIPPGWVVYEDDGHVNLIKKTDFELTHSPLIYVGVSGENYIGSLEQLFEKYAADDFFHDVIIVNNNGVSYVSAKYIKGEKNGRIWAFPFSKNRLVLAEGNAYMVEEVSLLVESIEKLRFENWQESQ